MRIDKINLSIREALLFWCSWYCLSVTIISPLPFLITGEPIASQDRNELFSTFVLSAALIPAAFAYGLFYLRHRSPHFLIVTCITSAALALAFLALIFFDSELTGYQVLISGVIVLALATIPNFVLAHWKSATLVLALIAGYTLYAAHLDQLFGRRAGIVNRTILIHTQFYDLNATYFKGFIPRTRRGGGITRIGNKFLLATGDGGIYELEWNGSTLSTLAAPFKVPLNIQSFNKSVPPAVDKAKFRVADILVRQEADKVMLFASHHYWHEGLNCFVLRISAL